MYPFCAIRLTCCCIALRPHEAEIAVVEELPAYLGAGISTAVFLHRAPQRLGSVCGVGLQPLVPLARRPV